MLGRAHVLSAILVLSIFAGCIGSPEEEPDVVEEASVNNNTVPENQTAAPDGRGDISAFKETNKTETGAGGMVHAHDYWEGKERLDDVAWLDAGLIPFPLMPCKKSDGSCTAGSANPGGPETYPAGTAIADFSLAPPPTMGMVYEGTKQVEVKLVKLTGPSDGGNAAPANPTGQVFFDYLAANDEPGKFRKGGELKLNEPFLIDIAPTDADMPHQTKSLWIFRIYSNSNMVWFEFNITISLIRGYDVVNWPPHPDLYANGPTRTVFEGPVKLSSKGTLDSNLYGTDSGWVNPEKVISWGTDKLKITVSNPVFTSQVPPAGYAFEFHNASKPPLMGNGAQYGGRFPVKTGETEYTFEVDLTADRGDAYDTPYAQYSRWGFRLVPQYDQVGAACVDDRFLQQFLVGCQFVPWEGTFDMKIVATGRSTAGGTPQASG